MRLEVREGDQLDVVAEGADAEEALEVFEATAHKCALDWAERLASLKGSKPLLSARQPQNSIL
jgi:hypothetical protein